MKKLLLHPAFLIGLALRLALMAWVLPAPVADWYAPFMASSAAHPSPDPWSAWMSHGGAAVAFPYGYAMWLTFLPMAVVSAVTGLSFSTGYLLTLLLCDAALLLVLHHHLAGNKRLALFTYWLSPIVILATYGLGFNDLIPALLLTAAFALLHAQRFAAAGVVTAAAISAKLSMAVALPILLIYLYNNRPLRLHMGRYLRGLGFAATALFLPFAFSSGGVAMLLNNPEMGKVFRLSLDMGGLSAVYLVPLAYLLMLYYAWRVKRLNFELLQSITGLAFLMLVLLTPAAPGWFIWCLPFLVLYQCTSGAMAVAITTAFTLLYALATLLGTGLQLHNGASVALANYLPLHGRLGTHAAALLQTGMVAAGIVLAMRIWRETITRNDFFRLSRKPFIVGIAGDSGAGKDTYADALAGLFGGHSVVKHSGDDYHLWDRQKPMWQVMTHLNPMANDLEGFCNDLIALSDGKTIHARHYDHQTGRMTRPRRIPSNDFIIASGLHTLYVPILRECCDLKVYLDINEDLRRHFKLRRDVKQRGHTVERVMASFEKREPDSERFIRPQAAHADLILSLQPIHPRVLGEMDSAAPLRLRLDVRTRHGFNELTLTRVLVGVCGLHVDMTPSEDGAQVSLSIEGETSAQDIAMAAHILCPRLVEFLDTAPQWKDGVMGLMQLITLTHINQALTKRII